MQGTSTKLLYLASCALCLFLVTYIMKFRFVIPLFLSVSAYSQDDVKAKYEAVRQAQRTELEQLTKWYQAETKKHMGNKTELQRLDAEHSAALIKSQDKMIHGYLALAAKYPNEKQSQNTLDAMSKFNLSMMGRYQELVIKTWDVMPVDFKKSVSGRTVSDNIKKIGDIYNINNGYIPDHVFQHNKDSVTLKSYRGKYLFLDFWTSWCTPCRAEHYNMKQVYSKYKSKGFDILQVSLDDKKEKWVKAINEDQLPWLSILNEKGWDKATEKKFNIVGVPTNYLIDPNGKIIGRNLRGEELNNKLSVLLK